MTPEEKAEQLVEKFYQKAPEVFGTGKAMEYAQQCAIIAVDEIIKETKLHDLTIYDHSRTGYWIEVKSEIEKL